MTNCIKPNDLKPNGIKPSDHLPLKLFNSRYFSILRASTSVAVVPGGQGRFVTAIWATKISALFGDNNIAQMSRRLNGQICSHTPSALNTGAKRSGATCHMAMPQFCYLAKGAKRVAVNRSNFSGRKD